MIPAAITHASASARYRPRHSPHNPAIQIGALKGSIESISSAKKPTGDMTILVRDDGKKMWAYKGKPIYTFKRDMAAGETNGDGFFDKMKTFFE